MAILLSVLALYLLVLAIVPQFAPDALDADLWAHAQARFGPATELFYRLGLFSLSASPVPRILLAILAFLLLVRLVVRAEGMCKTRSEKAGRLSMWRDGFSLLACLGPLLLLFGLLIDGMWGWRVEGLVGYAGDTLIVAGHGEVKLEETASGLCTARPLVMVYVTGDGPQLTVNAVDAQGMPLGLQRTSRSLSRPELTIPLTAQTPDAYFAIPSIGVMVRIALAAGTSLSVDTPLYVQVFEIPTGELIEEIELVGDEMYLALADARIEALRSPYLTLTVAYDPGWWFKIAGPLLGMIGLVAHLLLQPWRWGRGKWLQVVLRLLLALLTITVVGLFLQNLFMGGILAGDSVVPFGLAAACCLAWAVRVMLYRSNLAPAAGGKA
ncbi:MAG: hypothetical protein JW900_00660 [Anaerolineae bacterium]|nr:hypothetical protein [Anaerolineae bacterium]